MAANPRCLSEVVIEFNMGDQLYSQKEKMILVNTAKTCPVSLSLHPDLKQTVSFQFIDELIRTFNFILQF